MEFLCLVYSVQCTVYREQCTGNSVQEGTVMKLPPHAHFRAQCTFHGVGLLLSRFGVFTFYT